MYTSIFEMNEARRHFFWRSNETMIDLALATPARDLN